MIANDVNAAYRESRWAIALRGLIGILIGLVILARPQQSVAALALVVTFVNPGGSLLSLMRVLAVFGIAGGLLRLGLALQAPSFPSEMQRVARHPLRM